MGLIVFLNSVGENDREAAVRALDQDGEQRGGHKPSQSGELPVWSSPASGAALRGLSSVLSLSSTEPLNGQVKTN